MPIVRIQNLFGKAINVAASQTVLPAIVNAGNTWLHAGGAKGRCATCWLLITKGKLILMPGILSNKSFVVKTG